MFRLRLEKGESLLLPGFLYREHLERTGKFLDFEAKLARLPGGTEAKLAGAAHFYLWGTGALSVADVRKRSWKAFAEDLLSGRGTAGSLASMMDADSLKAAEEIKDAEWPYQYAKEEMIRGLNDVLADGKYSGFPGRFASYLKNPANCGQGASAAMVRELMDAGIDRARLTLDGADALAIRPDAAEAAKEAGYLFGIYDSYHSIHPDTLREDDSWETARLGQELYDKGAVIKADGSWYTGFNGKGRLLNPAAARSVFCERVTRNMGKGPLSFYFMDCDAAGEIYEDYNVRFPLSSEDAAAERLKRLRWLRNEKGLVVGSEGGLPMILPEILVRRGLSLPPLYGRIPISGTGNRNTS